jgi:pSer/pThr/pTyr-binding forkhead associated (FHA) protein
MQVVLVMFRGEGERRSFSIVRDVTVIGRREDCDFRIPLGEISRKHCRLIKEGDTLRAEDLGSSNGTFVNGVRVQEAQLAPGDTLKVGSVVFIVQVDGVPSDEDMQPVADHPADSVAALEPAPDEDHLLNPTAQTEFEPPAEITDEPLEQVDEQPLELEAAPEGEADQYDPMSVLSADPEGSSLGSIMDNDELVEGLHTELQERDESATTEN